MIMSRFALDVKPDSGPAHLLAAELQTAAKHQEAALRLLEEAARTSDPMAPIIRMRHAATLHQIGRTDEAIREVERIGRDYPDSTLPDLELGDLVATQTPFLGSDRLLRPCDRTSTPARAKRLGHLLQPRHRL